MRRIMFCSWGAVPVGVVRVHRYRCCRASARLAWMVGQYGQGAQRPGLVSRVRVSSHWGHRVIPAPASIWPAVRRALATRRVSLGLPAAGWVPSARGLVPSWRGLVPSWRGLVPAERVIGRPLGVGRGGLRVCLPSRPATRSMVDAGCMCSGCQAARRASGARTRCKGVRLAVSCPGCLAIRRRAYRI